MAAAVANVPAFLRPAIWRVPWAGIVIAHFGDLLGRKKMFTLSIMLMALPTLGMGLLPTYASIGAAAPILLLSLRILQGAAIGGEVPELGCSSPSTCPSVTPGSPWAPLTAGLDRGHSAGIAGRDEHQQRVRARGSRGVRLADPVSAGGGFGLFAVYLRRFLQETPIFKEMHAARALSDRAAAETDRARALSGGAARDVADVGAVRRDRGRDPVHSDVPADRVQSLAKVSLQANSVAIVCLTFGCVLFGWLADRIGSKWALFLGSLALLASSSYFYHSLPLEGPALFVAYAVTGLFVGSIGVVRACSCAPFPPRSALGLVVLVQCRVPRIFGGLTPVVLTLWLKSDKLAPRTTSRHSPRSAVY